jgi:hypothetical protein
MNGEVLKAILDGIGLTIFCIALGGDVIVNYPEWHRRDRRANELLRSVLTSEQYRELTRKGYLDIKSPRDPECIYRVPLGPGLVWVIEKGQQTASLCLQPLERVPDADMVVMHKLMIEADEATYLQTANTFTPMRSGGWND